MQRACALDQISKIISEDINITARTCLVHTIYDFVPKMICSHSLHYTLPSPSHPRIFKLRPLITTFVRLRLKTLLHTYAAALYCSVEKHFGRYRLYLAYLSQIPRSRFQYAIIMRCIFFSSTFV